MLPLLCRVFDIRVTEDDFKRPKRMDQLILFRDHVRSLIAKYFEQHGPNGYAALNVLTDFASRPRLYISQTAMVDQLQKTSGDWMTSFLAEIKSDKFHWENYLGDYIGYAKALSSCEPA
ncbi:MAG: hypothetical protein ABSH41_21995 [Syntrophobacteraceae bacterium]